ncbi:serine/threonine protein kinase [Jidongwangia harbinensis]|uniref:serine/threonine protein kinase n=1 Tax=Jidongwangia harbinensis TaxID=2878561 RepID=UPI001CD91BEE|nr:serine/threonine-protein kinase [Jidongwangia harbinensis]MCA2217800.1 serine/threonine protein kinase [Jidongwangia harbinensis]
MTAERAAHAPLHPRDPRQLGPYELLARLGEGGMGTVYLGRDPSGNQVAVKMVRGDLSLDEEFRRRFRSEVNRIRQVPPFCTAEMIDADLDAEQPYLVVEFVDGPSLAEVVQERGPLSTANLHGVAIGVATALTAIHGAGVIHRDLKPRNVLLPPGSPKVIDFGIARALEATSQHTRTDQMVGTVAYMSPERFGPDSASALTPAADVFAWGAVVTYAGTGRTPFHADSPPATAARILTQPPDLSGLTGPLRELIGHALAKDPADRPTARELLNGLVAGPATPAVLDRQPGLRAAAHEAQVATAYQSHRHQTALAPPPGLAGHPDGTPAGPGPAADDRSTRVVRPDAFRGPPLRGPLPRRRRLLPLLVLLCVLTLVVAAVLVLRGDLPWASAGGPVAPVVTTPPPDLRRTLLITDPLDDARLWEKSSDTKEGGRCTFADGALVVSRRTVGSFRCRGPADAEPNNLQVEVGVRLLAKGSCAALWFWFRPYSGYQVRICERAVYVGTHKDADVEVYRTFPLDGAPVPVGGPSTRITLTTRDGFAEVQRDGKVVGSVPLTDPQITGGRVVLGLFTEPEQADHIPPYRVAFDQVDIYALDP